MTSGDLLVLHQKPRVICSAVWESAHESHLKPVAIVLLVFGPPAVDQFHWILVQNHRLLAFVADQGPCLIKSRWLLP